MISLTSPAVTASEASAYVASRGLTGWPETEADQIAALRRGQDYIAYEYNAVWAEEWNTPPEAVTFAIIEAAIREAQAPGSLSVDWNDGRRIIAESESAGPTSQSFQYADSGSQRNRIPKIEGLLSPHITGLSAGVDLLRV